MSAVEARKAARAAGIGLRVDGDYLVLTGSEGPGTERVAVVGLSHEEAIAAVERLFDAIMSALEEDALQAIPDDEVFDKRYLAKTGTLGHRVLSMLT